MKVTFFSLVELMVTIALLSILFSLLSPSLKSMMGNASTMACKSNLASLAQVKFMYLEDYNQAFHFIREPTKIYSIDPWRVTTQHWYAMLEDDYMQPYDKSFSCPESFKPYNEESRRISYGFNYVYLGNYWIWRWYKARNNPSLSERARVYMNQIQKPQKQIVYGDMNREGVSY